MSERSESVRQNGQSRRLADAIREVKNAAADRDDVVVELREASRTRLELLAADLAPVFEDIPSDVELFDFTISSGLQPRLWIDAVAHVHLGRDRRTYRFVRDSRAGRILLAESASIELVAEQVTRYVAERLIERQRLLDGAPAPAIPGFSVNLGDGSDEGADARDRKRTEFMAGVGLFLSGALIGLAATVGVLWDRLSALFLGPGR